ncbi:putative transporter C09D4.1-like protein [Dinothrombium tinctorium]|uniref:Putative transporter C09D4.1-like protein n=1 Tax=Dinothrombium tinctorium TaxID=1965070 RepID=A0A3S4R7E7_9ACAR|nr:putative transporter C09D4.1-like protein [Dinothrombium tinctorium]
MGQSDAEKSSNGEEYRAYRWRFMVLLVHLLLQASTSFQMQALPSITNVVVSYYRVSALAVNWLGLVGILMSLIGFYPLTKAIEKYGIKVAINTVAFLCTLGACLKYLALGRNFFWLIFVGQICQSVSFQMTLFLTPTIAAVWFKSEESANVISIGQVALSLGFGVSFLPSMLIFKHANSIEEIRNGLSTIFISAAIFSVIFKATDGPECSTKIKGKY